MKFSTCIDKQVSGFVFFFSFFLLPMQIIFMAVGVRSIAGEEFLLFKKTNNIKFIIDCVVRLCRGLDAKVNKTSE